jgi:hypothetical protein
MYNYHQGTVQYDHARIKHVDQWMRKCGWSGALGWYRIIVWQPALAELGLFGEKEQELAAKRKEHVKIPTLLVAGR